MTGQVEVSMGKKLKSKCFEYQERGAVLGLCSLGWGGLRLERVAEAVSLVPGVCPRARL